MKPLDAWIVDAVRTPRGRARPDGALHGVKPIDLLGPCYRGLADRNVFETSAVEDVVLGCVTAVREQGANLAKISALYHGWSERISGTTVNRFCASGLDACNLAAAKVSSGMEGLVVAGGVESMSRVPMLSDGGAWFQDPEVAWATGFVHMGLAADLVATLTGLSRDDLDGYAARSQQRAARARDEGWFAPSLVAVPNKDGGHALDRDETIRDGVTPEKLAMLPPSFADVGAGGGDATVLSHYPHLARVEHLHTAGTSPAIADAASLLLVGNRDRIRELGLRPRARVRSFANLSVEPVVMLTGNPEVTHKALAKGGLDVADVDLFEVNESFAAVPLHFQRTLQIDPERLNVNGGAIALGHPLGATGGILVGTLLDELERRDLSLGVASICAGAGIAAATVIERI